MSKLRDAIKKQNLTGIKAGGITPSAAELSGAKPISKLRAAILTQQTGRTIAPTTRDSIFKPSSSDVMDASDFARNFAQINEEDTAQKAFESSLMDSVIDKSRMGMLTDGGLPVSKPLSDFATGAALKKAANEKQAEIMSPGNIFASSVLASDNPIVASMQMHKQMQNSAQEEYDYYQGTESRRENQQAQDWLLTHKIPGVSDVDQERVRAQLLAPKANIADQVNYNLQKDALKKAADIQNKNNAPKTFLDFLNLALSSTNSNLPVSAMRSDSALKLLVDSPAQVAYEKYIAAETEAEKQAQIEKVRKWAKEHPALAFGASLATSPLSGVDYLNRLTQQAAIGTTLPSSLPTATETTSNLRDGATEDRNGLDRFLYNTAASGLDSLIAGLTGGPVGGGIILGLGAASNTADDIKKRGGTDEQALLGGALAGIFEGVFEKVSLGNLKMMKEAPMDGVKTLVKNVAKSTVVNASEEAATEIANIVTDYYLMGELSNYILAVERYMAEGMSESKARAAAKRDMLAQIGESAVSGALMGAGNAVVGSASSYVGGRMAAAQSAPVAVSENGSDYGQAKAQIAPAVTQAEKTGVIKTSAAETQRNENPAAEMQRDVFESDAEVERNAPGFYSNDRFRGTDEDARYLDRLAKAAGISIEMAEARDGSNGWLVNGKAYLSEAAEDPLRVVAKHEITHHLQDAAGEAYSQYRSYVEQIYRDRGTLDQQISAVQQLYLENGTELSRDAALDELAADYAGELLENESLIRKLAGEDRGLAQRILDGIRDLLRRVRTAFGSEEVKQLDQAARLWEAALQETNAAYQRGEVIGTPEVRNQAIGKTTRNEPFVEIEEDILSGVSDEDRVSTVKKTLEKKFPDGITVGNNDIHIDYQSRKELTFSTYMKWLYNNDQQRYEDKLRSTNNADEILHATTGWVNEGLKHSRKDNIVDFARGTVLLRVGANDYSADVIVGTRKNGTMLLYDILDLQPTSFEKKETDVAKAENPSPGTNRSATSISDDTVSQERQSVKGSRDLQKQIDALERQNRRLKEQMARTDVPKVRRDVVKRSAKDLRSMYSSRIDLDVLTDRIENVYNQLSALSGAGNLQELEGIASWSEVRREMRSIADAILAESRGNVNPMAEEYSEIRRELRGRKISISDEYRSDLESAGGYEGLRKQNFGTFSLSKDGTPIDTVYEELNEKYPTLFPDDIVHPADQLVRLSDVMQELKAVEGNPFENDLNATAQYLAGEIEERFYDTPNQKPTLADKMANTYHRQRLKDQKELRTKLADQRRAYEEQVDGIHERYATENRKRIENQNAAQRRETIYRHATRLGKMLERPTDKRHIPEQLRGAALHMLRYINTESNYQFAYGDDAKYHRVAPGEVLGAEETGRTAAARALRAVYDDILKEGELSVDPDIGDYLEELAKMGNKTLLDMTRAELDTVWRVMQVVEHSITRANELHGEGRYRTVESMANALREGVGNRKDRTNWASLAGMVDQLLNRDMITPETFFHVLGDIGENIFRQMRRSADRQTSIIKEGSERAAQLIRESGVEFKKADKEHHTFQLDGGELTLSTSQLMELYALNKRKQAMEHIYIGGLKSVGGVKGLKETGRSKPVKVTPADVATMLEVLTDEQKALMDGLQAYLSGDLAKHGNEESMKVYGYEKFKEKNYWPIKVSRTETRSDPTSEARSKTIPGYGMTKAVIPQASNSVELRSAIDTFAAHLNQMATYASWLGTNEDVTRLHNFKFTDDQMNADGTVKELFERVYGKKGSKYLDDLLSDIAQGTKSGADKTMLEGMFGRWKAAKVGGNLRVIVQQPTAILRAMSIVDPKYLATTKNPLSGWKKALKYSQIAQWKDWGYFEMDTGRSIRELITGTEGKLDKAKNFFMWGAGAADSVSWGHLWNAVEAETAAKHKELTKGSKEFYEAVADRFAEVVDRTQVVDSVLHRTQIMRSNSYAAKLSTSFMSEPSKIYNMVVRDLYDLKSAPSIDARKKAGKQLARTTSSLIVSFAINAAAQALVDGLRDDDRDKKYGEKFVAAMPGNFISNFNVLSYLPYLKDLSSMLEGFTMERSDLEGVSDLINAAGQLGKAMNGSSEKSVLNAGLNAACRLGDLLGIPVSNLKRDAAAVFNTILVDAGLQELQYEMDKLLYNPEKAKGVFVSDLYRAMDSNPDAYNSIWEDLQTMPIEDIESSMESRMKKELGLNSVKNLPVRYSAPGEDPSFDALMRKAAKNGVDWYELLPEGSLELAQDLDALGADAKKLQRVVEIGASEYDDDVKYAALQLTLTDSEFEQFEAARSAGIKIDIWTDIYKAVSDATVARRGTTGAASQDDVEKALNKFKLTTAQWRSIWESYGWKSGCPR